MGEVPKVVVPTRHPDAILVRVVDVDISFGQMVLLLVKLAIASIPAAILLFIIGFVLVMLLGGLAGLSTLGR